MKKINRIISGIIAAAMMSVCIPATVSQAMATDDGNGSYVLTYGDYNGDPKTGHPMTGSFKTSITDENSYISIDTSIPGQTPAPESTISYEFDYTGEETTKYDVWVLATLNKDNALSRPDISFDGGEKTTIQDKFGKWINAGQDATTVAQDGVVSPRDYPLGGWTHPFPLNWCKVAENVNFKPGEHTLDYTVYPRGVGDGHVLTCYGGAMLVPSSYNWVPTSSTDVSASGSKYEINCDHSYAWIELEDYKTTVGGENTKCNDPKNENFSNHGALTMWGIGNEATYTYDFTLDNDGSDSYDIWYLGHKNVNWLSWFDYGIDANNLTPAGCSDPSDIVYTCTVDPNVPLEVMWQKAAENVTISDGDHVLTFKEKFRDESIDGYKQLFGVSDCIAIVPSNPGWTPTADDKSVKGRVNLDAHMLAYNLSNNAITASADIPLMGAAGSRYSYTSTDETVIGKDLTVHREDLYDKTCKLTPTITQGSVIEKASPITVTVKSIYSINDFKITDENGNEITKLTPNTTVKASAKIYGDVSETKSGAVIILALYDSQDRFVACATDSKTMTDTVKEIKAEMTLPGNVTGYSLKAFIWDSLTDLNVLKDLKVLY